MSRTILTKLIRSPIFGDKTLKRRMEELGMEKPSGPRRRGATNASNTPVARDANWRAWMP